MRLAFVNSFLLGVRRESSKAGSHSYLGIRDARYTIVEMLVVTGSTFENVVSYGVSPKIFVDTGSHPKKNCRYGVSSKKKM